MKTILITGASGYIGKQLSYNLSLKYRIIRIGRKKQTNDDYTWEELPRIKSDIVIHLAGKAHDSFNQNFNDYYEANVELTDKIINYCNKNKISQLIFVSTSKVYFNSESILTENSEKQANTPYQKTKLLAEDLIRNNLSTTKYHIIQPPIIVGEQEKGNLNLLKKLFSIIPIWPLGAFKNAKSVISFKNFQFFIEELVLKQTESNTYIICDDRNTSTIDLIKNKFPKVLILNTGKRFWKVLARLMTLFKFKFFDNEVLDKLTLSETYSNEKIKKDLNIKETIYDIAKTQ